MVGSHQVPRILTGFHPKFWIFVPVVCLNICIRIHIQIQMCIVITGRLDEYQLTMIGLVYDLNM